MQRTWTYDTVEKAGESVLINGWVRGLRRMGDKLVFIDVRDASGVLQVVCHKPSLDEASVQALEQLGNEYVIEIQGTVQKRGEKQINPDLRTGTIEVGATSVRILNTSKTPPFELDKDTRNVNEELRLKHRYLDLRTDRMQMNLYKRHQIISFIRTFLAKHHFMEIETPILTKGTPEGAREFLVPSRQHPGNFYVLPQSPQQFKQLLMVAGLERYFQIARCFRDEDQRGDRQPEFTQMDLEMSFVEREDVMALIESLLIDLVKTLAPEKKFQELPFPRMTYADAMKNYGTDRPDIRTDKNDPNLFAFCWVIDFPFFEKTEEGGWTFTHNPFSRATPEHRESLMNKEHIGDILTTQYDIVLNGFEIGGGSIRNHEPLALQRVFEIMGFPLENIQRDFGHMLEAFELGAPPHGGIAFGLDRIIALFCNELNIREVMAFPKTGDARDPMMGAPSPASDKALNDAHIQTKTS